MTLRGFREPGEPVETMEWHKTLGVSEERLRDSEEQVLIALTKHAKLVMKNQKDFGSIYFQKGLRRLAEQAIAACGGARPAPRP